MTPDISQIESMNGKVSDEEWRVRVELAALYRLVALEGWDDLIFNHISARLPGAEHQFLINPFGLFFEEITASSLVKIDLDGKVLQDTPFEINPAGFTIHSAVHMAREDAKVVMHLHSKYGTAVSAQKHGLLPITQQALIVRSKLAYHDYEGLAFDLSERDRLTADLGDKTLMLLRNHGTLAVGHTAASCWLGMYLLERACRLQVLALSAGAGNVAPLDDATQGLVARQSAGALGATLAWCGCLRKLQRLSPGYNA